VTDRRTDRQTELRRLRRATAVAAVARKNGSNLQSVYYNPSLKLFMFLKAGLWSNIHAISRDYTLTNQSLHVCSAYNHV